MWHFLNTNSPSLPAREDRSSEDIYLAGDAWEQWKSSLTPEKSSSPASATESYLGLPSGMTSELSEKTIQPAPRSSKKLKRSGKNLLSPAVSPVREFQRPAMDSAWMILAVDYGQNQPESFAKLSRDGCLWKTPQCSLFEEFETFYGTWPRWGEMQNGECFKLRTPSGLTAIRNLITKEQELEFSSRLPTPTVCGNYNRKGASPTSGDGLATALRRLPTPCKARAMPKARNRARNKSAKFCISH